MTVAKFVQPNFTDPAQTAAIYKAYIDGGFAVVSNIAAQFAPHAQDTANMTVRVDSGRVINADGTLTNVAAQNTGTITKPTLNPRIDRVVLNPATGAIAVIAGAEAVTPTAPAITAGYLPICQIALTTSTTAITNSMIVDERVLVRPTVMRTDVATDFVTVSLPDDTFVEVATVDLGTVNAGDRILVQCAVDLSNIPTRSRMSIYKKSGTALLATPTLPTKNNYNGGFVSEHLMAMLRVSGSGTLVLKAEVHQISGAAMTANGVLHAVVLNNR